MKRKALVLIPAIGLLTGLMLGLSSCQGDDEFENTPVDSVYTPPNNGGGNGGGTPIDSGSYTPPNNGGGNGGGTLIDSGSYTPPNNGGGIPVDSVG